MTTAQRTEHLWTRDGRAPITRRVDLAHERQVLYARLLLEQFRALAGRWNPRGLRPVPTPDDGRPI